MATIFSNIATYRLISGAWTSSDGETYYKTTIIGRGDDASDDSTKQTTNYSVTWAHGFGTFSLPSDATILSVKCVASVNRFWNNSFSGEFTGTLYNGDTAISASERFSGYSSGQQDAFEQQTINATTLPSVADINSGNVELRCSLPQAWCGKMFGATLYIEYLGSNGIFNMVLGGGGGWKKSTAVATNTNSVTFPVEHEPTEWVSFVISNNMYSGARKLNILRFSEGVGTFWSFSVSSSAIRTASNYFDSYLTAQYNGSSLVLQTSSTTYTFHSSATYQLLYR